MLFPIIPRSLSAPRFNTATFQIVAIDNQGRRAEEKANGNGASETIHYAPNVFIQGNQSAEPIFYAV
ncbi:MAG: hypothetical protein IPL65_14590 [Lewinellaceae bacterium]|nr:hypothetical protein [Lewinellaceae bacterium]